MKKKMFILISGCIAFTVFATKTQAQESSFAANQKTATSNYSNLRTTSSPLDPEDVNVNALKDFSSHFKDASTAKWLASGDLVSVYFTDNNIKKRSTYNAKGKLEYTISFLNESNMPAYVRSMVKDEYQFMDITTVTEVKRANTSAYFVKLEDKHSIFTVSVRHGEVELVEEISKQ